MNRIFLLLVSGIWILVSPSSRALIDTNENGLSDLWEKANNNGQLLPVAYDLQADPDQDGWTNAQEAAAGTDPNNPNPPDGILRPDIAHVPAVVGDENGQPVIITPESAVISWVTTPGKQYTLLYSPDLSANSWLPVGEPFIGTGFIREFGFPNADADCLFLRVAVTDADSDSDGLTDAEERTLGTNSLLADSDGDGSNDFDEIANATLPLIRDTDQDGVLDGDEASTGTNPLLAEDLDDDHMPDDWEKFMSTTLLEIFPDPAHWGARHTRLVNQDLDPAQSYTSDGLTAIDVCNVMVNTEDVGNGEGLQFEWQEKEESLMGSYEAEREIPYSGIGASSSPEWSRIPIASSYSDASSLSLAGLVSRHSALAWAPVSVRDGPSGDYTPLFTAFPHEVSEPERIGSFGIHAHSNYFSFGEDTSSGMIGRKKSFRVRMASRKPVAEDTNVIWLRVKYTGFSNSAINPDLINEIEACESTISKGGSFSTWLIADAEMPQSSQSAGDGKNVVLFPGLEVVNAQRKAVSELKVGKMSDTGVLSGSEALAILDIDKDADRFYVRLPGAASMGPASIKLATVDNPLASYNDDETEIDLEVEGSDLITKSMLLVSDSIDDGGAADDAKNDRTHKVQLGGKVKISSLAIGGKIIPVNLTVKVPYRKVLKGRVVLVGSAADDALAIAVLRDVAMERYAQTGVKIELPITTMDMPEGVNQNDVQHDGGVGQGNFVSDDMIKIIDKATLEEKRGKVTVFVVPNMAGASLGRAYSKRFTAPEHAAYALNAIVSAEDVLRGANLMRFTMAHEIGHLLTNNGHFPYDELNHTLEEIDHNLMRGGTSSSDSLGASKRILQSQEDMFLEELLSAP